MGHDFLYQMPFSITFLCAVELQYQDFVNSKKDQVWAHRLRRTNVVVQMVGNMSVYSWCKQH